MLFQVELEALDPNILREMLVAALSEYVDEEEQKRIRTKEKLEINRIRRRLDLRKG